MTRLAPLLHIILDNFDEFLYNRLVVVIPADVRNVFQDFFLLSDYSHDI